jgi:hypothetical protein
LALHNSGNRSATRKETRRTTGIEKRRQSQTIEHRSLFVRSPKAIDEAGAWELLERFVLVGNEWL